MHPVGTEGAVCVVQRVVILAGWLYRYPPTVVDDVLRWWLGSYALSWLSILRSAQLLVCPLLMELFFVTRIIRTRDPGCSSAAGTDNGLTLHCKEQGYLFTACIGCAAAVVCSCCCGVRLRTGSRTDDTRTAAAARCATSSIAVGTGSMRCTLVFGGSGRGISVRQCLQLY